jgi:hypothetical protein
VDGRDKPGQGREPKRHSMQAIFPHSPPIDLHRRLIEFVGGSLVIKTPLLTIERVPDYAVALSRLRLLEIQATFAGD